MSGSKTRGWIFSRMRFVLFCPIRSVCDGANITATASLSVSSHLRENYQGEPFTVDWGDGSKTEVVLNCYITWDDDDPTVHRYLVVDGAPAEDQLGWYVRLKR